MSKNTFSIVLLLLLACIWGSSFILMKRGMESLSGQAIFSFDQVGSLRMLIASLVLLPITIYSLKKINSLKVFLFLLIVGTFGNFIPAFLFTFAETELSSGYAGMLNSFTPIFALIIGGVLFKQKLTFSQIVGVLIAFTGIVLLMMAGKKLSSSGSWLHIYAIILATFMYGISLNTIKHKLNHLNSLEITSLSFGILLLPGLIATLSNGTFLVIKQNQYAYEGLLFIAILSVVGTALALIIFNRIIALSTTLFASSVTYLIPIVAVLIGLSFGEKISILQIASMFVVICGVLVANYWHLIQKNKSGVSSI
jgi:drug/metabolite transporter (DMT)-like permease